MSRLERLAKERGQTLPTGFVESIRPGSITGLELFWIAFWELRSTAAYEDPIPWSEVEFWGRAHGLNYDKRERLHELLSSMDATFRQWYRKAQAAASERSKR